MNSINIKSDNKFSYSMREALRSLRTNIQFLGDDIKVILLTSVAPNEGKTSVTFNLAKSMTESGKRVLFIDSDMRNSVVMGRYHIAPVDTEEIFGLSHYLSGQKTLDETIYSTNIDDLYMMMAGPSVLNPTELLEKDYFVKLIDFVREYFDYVLIDSVPLGAAIDSAIISRHCDGSILIVAQGQVPSGQILLAKKQLELAGSKILGVVLNKVRQKSGRYGGYYGDYYGEYYHHSSSKDSDSNSHSIGNYSGRNGRSSNTFHKK